MGKKGHGKAQKQKLTKKEKKKQNHLRLVQGKKGNASPGEDWNKKDDYKKSA